ncbi:MAG: PA2779 family protein [Thermodesulfovibrionales bacterium]
MRIPCMRCIAWYLAIAMFIIGIAPRVEAGLVKSEIVPLSYIDRASDLEKIQKVIETKAVSKRLAQLGLAQDEIQKRLNQLTDQQIHQIALQLDELKVGSDGLGLIIALLIIAILVVILLQLTGHRVIITK